MRVLDVGAGQAHKLISTYQEIDIIQCDKNPSDGVVEQDMEHLSYPNDYFDVVTCINALDHTKDAEKALQEIMRVARGCVYINCAIDQKTRHGKNHHWDAKADGRFVGKHDFDLKDYGFDIEFEDGRMMAWYR